MIPNGAGLQVGTPGLTPTLMKRETQITTCPILSPLVSTGLSSTRKNKDVMNHRILNLEVGALQSLHCTA